MSMSESQLDFPVCCADAFPRGMFAALTEWGVTGRAFQNGLCQLHLQDPRDLRRLIDTASVDDRPYGGGPGMVMQAPILSAAAQIRRKLRWARTQRSSR